MIIETPVIPIEPRWVGPGDTIFSGPFPYQIGELDQEAILFFLACGFFWEDETYLREVKTLKPATRYQCSSEGQIQNRKTLWHWHFDPQIEHLDTAVQKLDEILQKQLEAIKGQGVVLGLSGGVDSRCLAAACQRGGITPVTYSYQFPGGFPENDIGRAIAKSAGWQHHAWDVPKNALFEHIPQMIAANHCMANFVNPRQIFFIDAIKQLGDVLLLGHWGDVLFDSYTKAGDLKNMAFSALVKPKGLPLARAIARYWGQPKPVEEILHNRFDQLAGQLSDLPGPVQYRAIKSLHWAPRWTSVNLNYFSQALPLALPFYAQEIFDLVCACPEHLLGDRLLQIEYIKRYAPAMAKIPWQARYPYHLLNYGKFRTLHHLPYRLLARLKRMRQPLVQRNWELQYLGGGLDLLKKKLSQPQLLDWIGPDIPNQWFALFKNQPSQAADAMGLLHVLSEFAQRRWPEKD